MMTLSGALASATVAVFRRLPVGWVSAIGAGLGHCYALSAQLRGQLWFKRTISNFKHLQGCSETTARQRAFQLVRNSGRLTAEFAAIDRCLQTDRVTYEGLAYIDAVKKPFLIVSPHLGNWEIACSPLVHRRGIAVTALYDPPQDETLHRLARESRLRILSPVSGCRLVPASRQAMRHLVRAVAAGENVLIYIDEERDGLIWNPPLGRELPWRGNRVLAARLARKFDLGILPIRVRRVGGARFQVIVEPPLEGPRTQDDEADAREIATRLAELTERWVRADLDQWYWLPELRYYRPFPAMPDGD